jgi:hypothetical protein
MSLDRTIRHIYWVSEGSSTWYTETPPGLTDTYASPAVPGHRRPVNRTGVRLWVLSWCNSTGPIRPLAKPKSKDGTRYGSA